MAEITRTDAHTPETKVTTETKAPSLIPFVAFSNKKPFEALKCKITEETAENLMKAAMVEPVNEAQITMPTLEMYSKQQINQFFKDILKTSPKMNFKADLPFEPEFTTEEDFALLTYNRLFKEDGMKKYIKTHGHLFRPCRSIIELEKRADVLSKLSEDEKNEIIEKQCNQIVTEELFYISTNPQTKEQSELGLTPNIFIPSRCFYETYHQPPSRNPNVDSQIEQCMAKIPFITNFPNGCLAMLRTEKTVYYMKREAVTIGREAGKVDIDLSFESETCPHISRVQAILSFMDDLNFYVENIGNRSFRVNGNLIQQGEICIVKEGDILDFSGVLLFFIPNTRIIKEIKVKMEEKIQKNALNNERHDQLL